MACFLMTLLSETNSFCLNLELIHIKGEMGIAAAVFLEARCTSVAQPMALSTERKEAKLLLSHY